MIEWMKISNCGIWWSRGERERACMCTSHSNIIMKWKKKKEKKKGK